MLGVWMEPQSMEKTSKEIDEERKRLRASADRIDLCL